MKMRTVTAALLDYSQNNNVVPKDVNTHMTSGVCDYSVAILGDGCKVLCCIL
jgi:hypothetical protein